MSLARPVNTPQRITDVVHAQLRDAVLNRELRAGEPLSVPSLARRLKVSRSPVREAVLQLVADGLATNEPRRGAVVSVVNDAELLALYDIREVLEGLAARLAAQRMSDAVHLRMETALARQRDGVRRRDARIYWESDLDFHGALYDAAAVPRLRRLLEGLADQMRLSLSFLLVDPNLPGHGLKEHEAVLAALANGDAARAEHLMRRHLRKSRDRVAATLKRLAQGRAGPAGSSERVRSGSARSRSRAR